MKTQILEIPGGEIIGTGGGCEAISVSLPGDRYLLVTRIDDGGKPPSVGDEFVDVGIYPWGEMEALEWYEAMPTGDLLARLPAWTKE
jgi:hypothetical protein